MVLALVAGVTTWLLWPSQPGREPFDQALADLSSAPAVRYNTSALDGMVQMDVRTTSHGESLGSMSFQGLRFGVLVLGGKVYFKAPDGLLPDLRVDTPMTDALKDKWITGEDVLFGPALQQFEAPDKLAARLRSALDRTAEVPDSDDRGETVRGVPALKATTPAGELYVSRDAPYRVLRYTAGPPRTGDIAPLPSMPSFPHLPTMPSLPDFPPSIGHPIAHRLTAAGVAQQLPGGGLVETDLDRMSPEETDGVYNELLSNARQLTSAIDTSVQFNVTGSATISCGPGGCLVTALVNNTTSAANSGKVTGQVNTTMTATVTIEGRPAGGCQSTAVLPLDGSSSISCMNGPAGAVFSSVEAQKKAAAEQQSRALGGVPVPYQVQSIGVVDVMANAIGQVEVTKLVDQLEKKRDEVNNCGRTSNSFAAGTPVLMADGTARPIEQVAPGDRVRAEYPETGLPVETPVLERITGRGAKQLDRLTIRSGNRLGVVTATDNHLFWDPDKRSWVAAGSLRPGERLSASGGQEARVDAVQPYRDDAPVYNLSVAGPHTFMVIAGGTPVLVHNQGGELDPLRFYGDYTGRIDKFNTAGQSEFEIHVYYQGVEYGFYGSNGWFSKHGLPIPKDPPPQLESVLKGYAVDYMRRSGRLKADDDIKGDSWQRPRVAKKNC